LNFNVLMLNPGAGNIVKNFLLKPEQFWMDRRKLLAGVGNRKILVHTGRGQAEEAVHYEQYT